MSHDLAPPASLDGPMPFFLPHLAQIIKTYRHRIKPPRTFQGDAP
jgi:hypothetical protein